MAEQFLHGIETIEVDDGIRPVRTLRSAVIGVIGTAPDADATKYPLNEPVLIVGDPRKAADLGDTGTLKDSLDRIFEQGGATVIVVRVEEGVTAAETRANIVGSATSGTGVWAFLQARAKHGFSPRVLIAPGWTSYRVTDGITDVIMSTEGQSYSTAPTITFTPAGGNTPSISPTFTALLGTGADLGKVVEVRIDQPGEGITGSPTITISETPPTVGYVADAGNTGNGVFTLASPAYSSAVKDGDYVVTCTAAAGDGGTFSVVDPDAVNVGTATVGTPFDGPVKFTIADGATDFEVGDKFTVTVDIAGGFGASATLQVGNAKNPVAAALQSIASRLRAVVIADGPSTTDAAAVTYRGDFGDKRVYIVDPKVTVYDGATNSHVAYPASASVAGVIARVDKDRGFWWSPSNQELYGITGTSRPIDFNISDPTSQANYLNENEITTIIRHEGFRLWGNRTTSSDPIWAFLSVRRTADMVYESLEEAFLWAIDRPFSVNNILEIAESVNAYLRHLSALGAIINGKCWIDPTLNTADQMMQGKLYVDFDIEPPAPLEHLIFRAHRNGDYYEELIDDVVRKLAA